MIENALTPEEWAGEPVELTPGFWIHDDGDGVEFYTTAHGSPEKFKLDWWAHAERHAVAALCLNRMPFGFTHYDLVLLRELVDMANDECYKTTCLDKDITSLIVRIASLLPPEPKATMMR